MFNINNIPFNNKTLAILLSGILSIISWLVIIINIILRIGSFFNFSLGIDTFGFIIVTILLSIYTLIIFFKITSVAYFPIILILLHISSLNGSNITFIYVLIDLIILILLNIPAKQYHYHDKQTKQDDDNIIDAEYKTK